MRREEGRPKEATDKKKWTTEQMQNFFFPPQPKGFLNPVSPIAEPEAVVVVVEAVVAEVVGLLDETVTVVLLPLPNLGKGGGERGPPLSSSLVRGKSFLLKLRG